MTVDAWLTLALIAVLFTLLIIDIWPAWVVFSAALAVIITLDLAPEAEAVMGFANTGILTVVVMYIVAAAMYRTGAISMIISRLVSQPRSEKQANLRMLPLTALGSAFLNNTPIVAMLIPVIADLGRSARLAVSKIYMAVSDASILGGAATLIGTSTNLVIAGLGLAEFGEDLGIFFPTPVALPAMVVGLAFLVFVARRLMDDTSPGDLDSAEQRRYRAEFFLPPGSRLAGETLRAAGFADPVGAELLSVETETGEARKIGPELVLNEGDRLAFSATVESLPTLWSTIGIQAANPGIETGNEYAHRLIEAAIDNDAPEIGELIGTSGLFTRSGRRIVALSRTGRAVPTPLAETSVKGGDVAVLEVREEFLDEGHDDEFTLIRRLRGYRIQRVDRAVIASLIVSAMVLASALGLMSLLNAGLLAVAALIATGCLTIRRAWRSIDWQTYVVLAAAVGLEPAVTSSGLADVISDILLDISGDKAFVALIAVFLGAIILTNVVTNAAAAALMFPITASIVASLGVAWEPFVVVLMLGCSYAFINPAGYQTNLMVLEPGGYSFVDFVKVGLPLTLLLGLVAVPLAALIYGL